MRPLLLLSAALISLTAGRAALAADAPASATPQPASCSALPSQSVLKDTLTTARRQNNGGLNNDMWGVLVDRTGTVCAVAYTGDTVDAQWPGSRIIAETKANTANALSLKGAALSTANIWAGSQPGGFLFGIANSHPVDIGVAYKGPAATYGTTKDPMVGHYVGGITVFGGGLALYNAQGAIVGALGVSGDTSCADHNIAWRARNSLKLDYVPGGMSPNKDDQIIYDVSGTTSKSGFGQPTCGGKEVDVAKQLPPVSRAGAVQKQ